MLIIVVRNIRVPILKVYSRRPRHVEVEGRGRESVHSFSIFL